MHGFGLHGMVMAWWRRGHGLVMAWSWRGNGVVIMARSWLGPGMGMAWSCRVWSKSWHRNDMMILLPLHACCMVIAWLLQVASQSNGMVMSWYWHGKGADMA